jgi:hypothetical protein
MYTWFTRIQTAYAVTQHTVTLPGRSLLSKNHMVSRYARRIGWAVPVFIELALPRQFSFWKPCIELHENPCCWATEGYMWSPYTVIISYFVKNAHQVQEPIRKLHFFSHRSTNHSQNPTCNSKRHSAIPAINHINTKYTLFLSALHVGWGGVFMWLDTTGRLPLNWSLTEQYQWLSYTSGSAIPVVELHQWLSYTSGWATPVAQLYQWLRYTTAPTTPI